MMVECEHGIEERSLGGQITLSRSPRQGQDAAKQGSSYFNRQEAVLAIRHADFHGPTFSCFARPGNSCSALLLMFAYEYPFPMLLKHGNLRSRRDWSCHRVCPK